MVENEKNSGWPDLLKKAEVLWREGLKDQALLQAQSTLDATAASLGINSNEYLDCTVAVGCLLNRFEMGMEALGVFNRAREMADFNLGENNRYRPQILLGISAAYKLQNFSEESKLYEELALESLAETKWDKVEDFVPVLGELAASLGEDPLFRKLSDEVVSGISNIQLEELLNLSDPLLRIASNLFAIGESEKAILMLSKLVEFHERYNGDMLPTFLSVLELGVAACELSGKHETALRWSSLAYEINSDVYGADSIEVAGATISLVRLLIQFGDLDEVIRLCEHALSIVKPASEDEDFKLEEASIRKYLGECFCALGDFEAAREHLLLAYEIYRAHERTSDPAVAETLHNLGVIALSDGALDDALRFLGKAYAIREKIFGSHHESVAISLVALGACHEARGNVEEAKRCQKRASEISGSPSPNAIDALNELENEISSDTEIIEEPIQFPQEHSSAPLAGTNVKAIVSIVRAAKTLIQTKQESEAVELLNEAIALIETMGGEKKEVPGEDNTNEGQAEGY